jgi:hypothetical protein
MHEILALDIGGTPFAWIAPRDAVGYYAARKVAWDLGDDTLTFRGGMNRAGERSTIVARPIIAIAGSELMARYARGIIPLGDRNAMLFRRDRMVCAYCGGAFRRDDLTRDHIVPRAQGGADRWMNVVSACQACNVRKGNRTPEAAVMPLLYAPYEPCRWEHFILAGRNILADQMEYLKAALPKHSRAA